MTWLQPTKNKKGELINFTMWGTFSTYSLILRPLLNLNVHYRTHKSLLDSILNCGRWIYSTTYFVTTITILLLPTLRSPNWSFRFKFTYRSPVRISHLSRICNVRSPDLHHTNTYAVGMSVRSDQRRCSKAEGLLGLRPILNMKNEIFMVTSTLIVLFCATIPYSMIAIYQLFQGKILPLRSERKWTQTAGSSNVGANRKNTRHHIVQCIC
jgi:hypothetical protein